MTAPAHGGQMRALAERFGVDARGLVDFSANLNPEGPPEGVVRALRGALEDGAVVGAYPDLDEVVLRGAIARHVNVPVEQVVVANGVVPLLEAALRALGVEHCLLPVPSFSEYRGALERVGVRVTSFGLAGFRYERDGVMAALEDSGCDGLLLANPQNPSGAVCGREEMLALIAECGRRGVRVLLDEAFIDYAPGESVCGAVEGMPCLTVFRSLTKFYGMPGLRIAYAVAHESVAGGMKGQIAAWPVTTLAAVGVMAALADALYAARTLELNAGRRERLVRGMRGLGVETYTPGANFVLLRLPDGVDASACWERMIVEHGVVVRDCSNFEGLGAGHLRCGVRGDVENERLVRALGLVLTVSLVA